MEEALGILWTGDPAAKREVADDAYFRFGPLFGPHPGDDEDVARILSSLASLIRSEKDDFISYRLLSELSDRDGEILTPLFLEALKSRSANLRGRAIHWFAGHTNPGAVPELEFDWRHEERPWVRKDLMIALVRHGSRDNSGEFLDLARGKDATLATAAIRALTLIGDPRVIPFLVRIARASSSSSGLLAVDALARWPDSREALEAILEASRSPRVDFQRHAAAALGRFDHPTAAARLLSLTTGHADPGVRGTALVSLRRANPAALVPIALGILRETPTQENAPVQSAAIGVLRDLDDPSIIPQLAGLEFSPQDSRFHELRSLKQLLGRPRGEDDSKRPAALREGGDDDVTLEEDEPVRLVIAPPPAMLTVRRWKYPEVPGDPEEFFRLPAGKEVEITDHFERPDQSWASLAECDCWVPSRFLESAAAARLSKDVDKETSMFIRREFDLPAGEVESDVAQGLIDAGLMEVIEPGDEVIGVAISIDPQDFDRVLLLARSCGLNETLLDGEIYDLVSNLAPLYTGHPALDRFRKAPPIHRGETDEVIDLDIEQLTDR